MSNFSFNGKRKDYCNYLDYTSAWGQNRELEITDVKGAREASSLLLIRKLER